MDKLFTILISSFLAATPVHATEIIKILEGDNIEPYAIKNNPISQGAEVDIIKAAFRDSDFTPVFVFVPLARVTINFDWPDIAGSARMTEVGKKGFFTNDYIRYRACFITLDERRSIQEIADMANYSIVAFQGASVSFGEQFFAVTRQSPRYQELNDQVAQLEMLMAQRTDAIVADQYIAQYKLAELTQRGRVKSGKISCSYEFKNSPYRAFFKNKAVADTFNSGLAKIIQSGEYEQILKRYGLKNRLQP
ncbi:transporter substrate-binding domain-containing protein [Undibacterium jejuense]|uniref:Transporter substrate-binding domain-containing protein n=1 Tax=Undibacterium jejuense TaxID=1344949 RepID=A0A923HFU9_9BURK|nr:transporter substrate-binding domain-containing protein [Undibacterium jejuense]MBC3862959.1 transporter substrate-binding domain-containing protein [Undibacterium jejuense]